jgi:F-type H+-transporting ATPase subunit a
MDVKRFKYSMVATLAMFCVAFCTLLSTVANAAPVEDSVPQVQASAVVPAAPEAEKKEGFDADKVILEHIKDSHVWHFFDINGHPVALSLPVILYVPKQGFSMFFSSRFHHGETSYEGFRMMTKEYIAQYKLSPNTYFAGRIIAVHPDNSPNLDIPVYDFSLTRNVLQMILSAILLILIFNGMARKYSRDPHKAPSGFQNALEPVVLFIRDDVARPYLGNKADKYLPYLLTIFFFIWINSILALIPGSANVAGNLAFTGVLAAFTFIFILISTNKAYWGHIVWPPGVPLWVKPILIPVEILGIFTKPFALMIRLFANMLAGHMIILSIISLIFIFGGLAVAAGWGFSVVSILFTIFMYLVELLVGVIQAFIFANLSALFIAQAFEHGGHHEGPEEDVIL